IGQIRAAKELGLPVRFTVDSFPDDLFEGKITQIRMNSTTVQNVVTYPVVVSAANPDLKLTPGMTASLSFQVKEAKDAVRIPSAPLRFFPKGEWVRPEDRKLLEFGQMQSSASTDENPVKLTAEEKAESRKARNKRYVWVVDESFLKAVPITTGVSDNRYSEMR